jgi:hypothetical protein
VVLGEEQDEQDDENQGADADVHGVPPRRDVIFAVASVPADFQG